MPESGLNRAAAGRYVLSRHDPGAGYSFYRVPEWGVEEPHAPDTFFALRCLNLLNLEIPEPTETATWLRSLQAAGGGYPSVPIGWGAMRALGELGLRPKWSSSTWVLEEWARAFARDGRRRREWAGALRTARQLIEMRQFCGLELKADDVDALLTESMDPRGGWAAPGADLESTAVALQIADAIDERERYDEAAAVLLSRCGDKLLGFLVAPMSGSTSTGALWGGLTIVDVLKLTLHHGGAIARNLRSAQRVDGGVGRRSDAISTLHDTLVAIEADLLLERLAS